MRAAFLVFAVTLLVAAGPPAGSAHRAGGGLVALVTAEGENSLVAVSLPDGRVIRRVTLPAIRWAIAYGVVLTTARALGEFGAVSVVSGRIVGKTETLTLYVQDQYESFNATGAYAASVLLALLAIGTLVLMTVFRPKEGT